VKIRYDITLDDLVAAHRHRCRHTPSLQILQALLVWPIPLGILIVCGFISFRDRTVFLVLLGLAIAAVYVPVVQRALRRNFEEAVRRRYAGVQNPGVLGPHTLELATDSIIEHSPTGERRTALTAIWRVFCTDTHVFIYGAAAMPGVIPRQAAGADDLRAFMEALRRALPGQVMRGL